MKLEPRVGEVVEILIPVKVLFKYSHLIACQFDESNEPVEFRSGFIMEVLPDQELVYEGQEFLPLFSTAPLKS